MNCHINHTDPTPLETEISDITYLSILICGHIWLLSTEGREMPRTGSGLQLGITYSCSNDRIHL